MSTRKALVVGVNNYEHISCLYGCANDARLVKSVLARNGDSDRTKNFDVDLVIADHDNNYFLKRKELKNKVEELFKYKNDIALFYFAGHGYVESTGGYLITSECTSGDDGLPTNELLHIANKSPAKNKIIILDSCHSGITGNLSPNEDKATLNEGITILTASGADQYAKEDNGSGVFTTLFVDAMNGGAANIIGEVTPGSIYAHIDQSLGSWEQRPIFKTNVSNFTILRKVQPSVSLEELQEITALFADKNAPLRLDPSFEPESRHPDEQNVRKFAILQKYCKVNLVVPVNAPHMWHAAMQKQSCKLTMLGKHYWNLVDKDRI